MPAFRTIALAVTLILVPTLAWAKCSDRKVPGDYRLYATTHTLADTVWTTCDVRVERDGTITPGGPCMQRNIVGAEIETMVDGGAILLTGDCEVSGSIIIDGHESIITNALMSHDMNIIEGMGINPDDSTLRFSVIRQR